MDSPNLLQTIFAIFYAIFWGVVANAQPKWRAFNWPIAFTYERTRRRLVLSLLVLNLLPMSIFVTFFFMLAGVGLDWGTFRVLRTLDVSGCPALQVFLVIVAAMAPFAVSRLWLGMVEFAPKCYYYRPSQEPCLKRSAEPRLSEEGTDAISLHPRFSSGNLTVAIVQLVVCVVAVLALCNGGPHPLIVVGAILLPLLLGAFSVLRFTYAPSPDQRPAAHAGARLRRVPCWIRFWGILLLLAGLHLETGFWLTRGWEPSIVLRELCGDAYGAQWVRLAVWAIALIASLGLAGAILFYSCCARKCRRRLLRCSRPVSIPPRS